MFLRFYDFAHGSLKDFIYIIIHCPFRGFLKRWMDDFGQAITSPDCMYHATCSSPYYGQWAHADVWYMYLWILRVYRKGWGRKPFGKGASGDSHICLMAKSEVRSHVVAQTPLILLRVTTTVKICLDLITWPREAIVFLMELSTYLSIISTLNVTMTKAKKTILLFPLVVSLVFPSDLHSLFVYFYIAIKISADYLSRAWPAVVIRNFYLDTLAPKI